MKRGSEKKELARRQRSKVFHLSFLVLAVFVAVFLIWQLRSLLLPILVGALLAYLFRPVKDRFQIKWLSHELRVLSLFACIGFMIFVMANNVRKHVPNERQKLELQVRIKYKLNEKFQELVGTNNAEKRSTAVAHLISREAGPMMDQLNRFLDLSPDEQELFMKYRAGHKGEQPISDRFFEYFQANQTTSTYTVVEREPSAVTKPEMAASGGHGESKTHSKKGLMEELSIWILAPLIFIFLGFDNGQIRRYFLGLIPNRYFELSLTVVDMLDEAIGKYLRGTLMECALVGLTLTIGFILIGIPVSISIAIGVVSGLVNAIPFLGTVIGLVIGLGYALIAENVTPLVPGLNPNDLAVYVVVLVSVTHLLDNALFAPLVLGNAVNLHPLVIAIAIISGSLLMGVWGMLFAVPTVVIVKTAVETLFKELKDYKII
ncbi:MAG TPA: AI-2E family transporter [Bdellovibrionales bacterium]|nr:AI-2E family transporter [Bdellovibrionales bacterium]